MYILTTSCCALLLWMQTLTLVKSQDCTLEDFIKGNLYDSNFDTSDLDAVYPSGEIVRVGCNVGYTGFFKLTCYKGTWSKKGSVCQARSCGHPGDAPFADFHLEMGDDFVFGSQVQYTCHKGYQMISRSNIRRCLEAGWDGVVPVCEAQQCSPITTDDNVLVIGDPDDANYGNVLRFRCKSNSEVLIGQQEIYCNERGEWNGKPPTCEDANCRPPTIANGRVVGNVQTFGENDYLNFQCNAGFQPQDPRAVQCTKVGQRVEWSPTPACKMITCEVKLPSLLGTSYEPAGQNVFAPGDTLTVTCGPSQGISRSQDQSAVVRCKADGQWSIFPVCKDVICSNDKPRLVDRWDIWAGGYTWAGGNVRYSKRLNETVWYQCRSGFKKPAGVTHATCSRDGWMPKLLCAEVHCDRQELPKTELLSSRDVYNFGDTVTYRCKDGYEGSFMRRCGNQGWSSESAVTHCREIRCQAPVVRGATVVSAWQTSYSHNDSVTFKCTANPARLFTVVCQSGDWTGKQNCAECIKENIPHGFMVGPVAGKFYYTCDPGYKPVSAGWWAESECKGGVLTGLNLCIVNSSCGKLPDIAHASMMSLLDHHPNGYSRRVTCQNGYAAQVEELTCRDGTWHPDSSVSSVCAPRAQLCSAPPKVADASIIGRIYKKKFLSGTDLTYKCREHHTMEGTAKITCKDGKWETPEIKCIPPPQPTVRPVPTTTAGAETEA